MQRIVLTGFMGSGKTTVGRLLARELGWEFLDLDRAVESQAGQSVPSLFAEHGEAHFRSLEAAVLATLLVRERLVLALGGGAPEFPATLQLLQRAPATHIVYLVAPFGTLAERCRLESTVPDAIARPLFQDQVEAEERFRRREPLYRSLAHTRLETNGIPADEVVQALLGLLAQR